MKRLILLLALGTTLFMTVLVFGLGYFVYSLLPSKDTMINLAQGGIVTIEENGRQIKKRVSPECIQDLEKFTSTASLWSLIQAEDWTQMMPKNCLKDVDATINNIQDQIPSESDWKSTDDPETI